jgi:hypothetical protein
MRAALPAAAGLSLLAAATLSLLAAPAGPDRAALSALEKTFDRRFESLFDDPFLLLGMTRAVYVPGAGAVFSAEVALVISPGGPLARPDREVLDRLHRKRLERLPELKQAMAGLLVRAGSALETVPEGERIVLGVTLFRKSGEPAAGLPSQIVMQATRRELAAKQEAAIQVSEY